jgi:hypothetical protein
MIQGYDATSQEDISRHLKSNKAKVKVYVIQPFENQKIKKGLTL